MRTGLPAMRTGLPAMRTGLPAMRTGLPAMQRGRLPSLSDDWPKSDISTHHLSELVRESIEMIRARGARPGRVPVIP
jgi:hypothetical protein